MVKLLETAGVEEVMTLLEMAGVAVNGAHPVRASPLNCADTVSRPPKYSSSKEGSGMPAV